jgi:hypothetical protein
MEVGYEMLGEHSGVRNYRDELAQYADKNFQFENFELIDSGLQEILDLNSERKGYLLT